MTWSEMLKADAAAMAADADGPFEQVIFYPRGVTLNQRTLSVEIRRRDFGNLPESGNVNVFAVDILVPRGEAGVDQIFPGQDAFIVQSRLGGDFIRAVVRTVLEQTQGFYLVTATT